MPRLYQRADWEARPGQNKKEFYDRFVKEAAIVESVIKLMLLLAAKHGWPCSFQFLDGNNWLHRVVAGDFDARTTTQPVRGVVHHPDCSHPAALLGFMEHLAANKQLPKEQKKYRYLPVSAKLFKCLSIDFERPGNVQQLAMNNLLYLVERCDPANVNWEPPPVVAVDDPFNQPIYFDHMQIDNLIFSILEQHPSDALNAQASASLDNAVDIISSVTPASFEESGVSELESNVSEQENEELGQALDIIAPDLQNYSAPPLPVSVLGKRARESFTQQPAPTRKRQRITGITLPDRPSEPGQHSFASTTSSSTFSPVLPNANPNQRELLSWLTPTFYNQKFAVRRPKTHALRPPDSPCQRVRVG